MGFSNLPDVDIDVSERSHALAGILSTGVPASMTIDGELKKHPTGIFVQNIPTCPISGLAAFPSGKKSFDIAEELGYIKLDILPNGALLGIETPDHMDELNKKIDQIDWDWFQDEMIVCHLHHLGNYFEVVSAYEPNCVQHIAMLIAMIRPAKKHLIGEQWDVIEREIWVRGDNDDYFFKKSHAFGFAQLILVQLLALKGF